MFERSAPESYFYLPVTNTCANKKCMQGWERMGRGGRGRGRGRGREEGTEDILSTYSVSDNRKDFFKNDRRWPAPA
jgi:hypothetical protein